MVTPIEPGTADRLPSYERVIGGRRRSEASLQARKEKRGKRVRVLS